MRSIEFLAPVESMRGNLSGNQVLDYPTNDNSAWDAPAGKTSYARNYQTRYVGAKRSSSGLKYFSVRTKFAVANTALTRLQQAALGASRVIYEQLAADLENLVTFSYIFKNSGGRFKTMSGCICDYIIRGLKQRGNSFVIGNPLATAANKIVIENPWGSGSAPVGSKTVTIPQDMFIKFFPELTNMPGTFGYVYLYGVRGIGGGGLKFDSLVDPYGGRLDVWGVTQETVGETSYATIGSGVYLLKNGQYVSIEDEIPVGTTYTTTAIAPEP